MDIYFKQNKYIITCHNTSHSHFIGAIRSVLFLFDISIFFLVGVIGRNVPANTIISIDIATHK